MTAGDLAARLDARRSGTQWSAKCPAHEDGTASLSITEGIDGRILLRCFAGCAVEAIVGALGLKMADLFERRQGEGRTPSPHATRATDQHLEGCTLAAYAEAKRLPEAFLRNLGLTQIVYCGTPAVRIPAFNEDGSEASVQFRIALAGNNKFRFKAGCKPTPHGRERLAAARQAGEIAIVEGPSDYQTAVLHGVPVYGLPSATAWREDRDAVALADVRTIYVVIEPDRGGETLLGTLARSRIRDQVRVVTIDGVKDLSDLHIADPDQFLARWAVAKAAARSLAQLSAEKAAQRRATLGPAVKALAECRSILDEFSRDLTRSGVVGEERSAKLLFLTVTSRLREWPIAAKVTGPSSGGKSWLVERTLEFFPSAVCHALTAMSERALAYGEEDLQHRVLVLYEAAALSNDFGSYLLRSLLSERCVRYETVEKTKDGIRPRLIERPGPTGLILTTTAVRLHPENETRLLGIPITDTPEQTRAVMRATARKSPAIDLQRWREFHEWIACGGQDVIVPYAERLAEMIPPVAVRLRRDFRVLLALIETHALLHQVTRCRDKEGRIEASKDDYLAIRALVVDLLGETLEASVPASVRDTVQAVVEELAPADNETSVSRVAKRLALDKSAVSRRVQAAIARGFLKNLETGRGRPARLVLGDPLPDDQQILPRAEDLFPDRCSVDAVAAEARSPFSHEESGDGVEWERAW